MANPLVFPTAARYVLITQCLQNDFFHNPGCRLRLPDLVVREMLLGKRHLDAHPPDAGAEAFSRREVKRGPLGLLLALTIEARAKRGLLYDGILHVINVRDWHIGTSQSYHKERRIYGRHCEAGTWGAGYIDGIAPYLDPGLSRSTEQATYFAAGSVRVYHVHSESVLDFKGSPFAPGSRRVAPTSALKNYLDIIAEGAEEDLAALHDLMERHPTPEELHRFAQNAAENEGTDVPVRVGVIGVHTDTRVQALLTCLQTLYDLDVAVSDTFTASATFERHLAALDYATKVLGVEVIHGINDFVRFLGGSEQIENEDSVIAVEPYASYEHFFQDQRNVLAGHREFLAANESRALAVYELVKRANEFLIVFGALFLVASLGFAIASAVAPGRIAWELPAITGGLSIAQFVTAFFRTPTVDLQQNLTNLARLNLTLESQSFKTALIRFHFTTTRTLRPIESAAQAEEARLQIDTVRRQLEVIRMAGLVDSLPEAPGVATPELDGKIKADDAKSAPLAADVMDEVSREEAR